jgi:hypothetical protein
MYLRQTAQHEELARQRIELRRKEHAERLARIMDEKNRIMGLDLPSLATQVEERRAREATELADEQDYQRRFLEEQRLLGRLAREEAHIRRQIELDDIAFRRDFQATEQSREWDITRPDYLKVQPPVRATDNDPWLSVSGGQKFDGEDLGSADRERRQGEQRRRWQAQQIAENEHKRAVELAEQREWERRYIENDRRMQDIEAQQNAARREIEARNDDENWRALQDRKRREAEDKRDEQAVNDWEIGTTNHSPFMAESRGQAVGRGGTRIVQDWKGMSEAERKKILEDRAAQREADARRKKEEEDREKREDAQRLWETREAIKRERAGERARKQAERELAHDHLADAEQHTERELEMNKVVYGTNQPQRDFWSYFGKSHR